MFMFDTTGIIPNQPRYKHGALLVFVVLLLSLGLLPEYLLQQLQFPFNGEFSLRWYSAHFIHLNFKHALMNAGGAVLIWLLVCAFYPAVYCLPCWWFYLLLLVLA